MMMAKKTECPPISYTMPSLLLEPVAALGASRLVRFATPGSRARGNNSHTGLHHHLAAELLQVVAL